MAADTAMLHGPTTQAEVELLVACRTMEAPPYLVQHEDGKPDTRLKRALELVQADKVFPQPNGTYFVQGNSTQMYVCNGECSCRQGQHGKSKWCYHLVAAKLYKEWQQRLRTAGLLSRETPPTTPQDAPGSTNAHVMTLETPMPETVPQPTDQDPESPHTVLPSNGTEAPTIPQNVPQPTFAVRPTLPRYRSMHAILADLARPLPKECVSIKKMKSAKSSKEHEEMYLHWDVVAAVLDAYAPGWSGQIVRVEPIAGSVGVVYRLTIPCAEGQLIQEDFGVEDEDIDGYGDTFSNATAMAMKRAAAKMGVGRWLYDKEGTAAAFQKHLAATKRDALQALGTALDTARMDRQSFITGLKRHTGMIRNSELPLGVIQAALQAIAKE